MALNSACELAAALILCVLREPGRPLAYLLRAEKSCYFCPSATERVEGILLVVQELYMVDPALVARVLPNLQAELVILERICSYRFYVVFFTSTCESFTKMLWQVLVLMN